MLETRSVVDALRSEMQGQILRGSIPAGTALPELSVARMFDVARPTAKAAIEMLVCDGLLRRMRNKTARVPLLTAFDVADLYLSRAVVETAVARVLAERGQVPSGAANALERLRAAIGDSSKAPDLVTSDIEFHCALVDATGSTRLRRLHELVIGETHLCLAQVQIHQLLDPRIIADEHARILAMIEARDADQATAAMDGHISRARIKLVDYLQDEKDSVASAGVADAE